MKSRVHYQTSTVQPLDFGNGKVISPKIELGMQLPIHAKIKIEKMIPDVWPPVAPFINMV